VLGQKGARARKRRATESFPVRDDR
jgi:hypothetical protein